MSHAESSVDLIKGSKKMELNISVCEQYHLIDVSGENGKEISSVDSRDTEDEEDEEQGRIEKLESELEKISEKSHFGKITLVFPELTDEMYAKHPYDECLSDGDRMDVIELMRRFDADVFHIEAGEDHFDWDHPYPSTMSVMDYASLLSVCERRKEVDIEFVLDSITLEEWKKMREEILSRRLSLDSLNIRIEEDVANEFLNEIFGVKFEREKRNNSHSPLKFYSAEKGKTVDCDDEGCNFSVHFFDGLFRTEIYSLGGDERFDHFGLKMEWIENDEKLAEIKKDYKSVDCVEKRRAVKRKSDNK